MAHKRPADLPSWMQHNLKIHCASLEEAGNLCSSFPRVSSCNKKFSPETLWAGSASPPVPGPFAAHKARRDAGALTPLHLASPHVAASTGLDLQSKLHAPGLAPQTLEDATQQRSLFPSPVPHGPGSMVILKHPQFLQLSCHHHCSVVSGPAADKQHTCAICKPSKQRGKPNKLIFAPAPQLLGMFDALVQLSVLHSVAKGGSRSHITNPVFFLKDFERGWTLLGKVRLIPHFFTGRLYQ